MLATNKWHIGFNGHMTFCSLCLHFVWYRAPSDTIESLGWCVAVRNPRRHDSDFGACDIRHFHSRLRGDVSCHAQFIPSTCLMTTLSPYFRTSESLGHDDVRVSTLDELSWQARVARSISRVKCSCRVAKPKTKHCRCPRIYRYGPSCETSLCQTNPSA